MIKLCGLWENKDKDGNVYFQGKLGYGAKIMIFRNTYQSGEKSPDWILYIAEDKKREGQGGRTWRREDHIVGSPPGLKGEGEPKGEDEDGVPF